MFAIFKPARERIKNHQIQNGLGLRLETALNRSSVCRLSLLCIKSQLPFSVLLVLTSAMEVRLQVDSLSFPGTPAVHVPGTPAFLKRPFLDPHQTVQ